MDDQAAGGAVASETPTDNSKGIKRAAEDVGEGKVVKKQETESLYAQTEPHPDDRNTFRLNPPKLIHGVAKPAPKGEDDSSENKEKPLLRPSLFPATANPFLKTLNPADSTSQEVADPHAPKEGEGGGGDPDQDSEKPKVNFLKLSTGESDRDVGFGVFGTFSDRNLHKVDFSAKEKEKDKNGGENYFLQFSESSGKSEAELKQSPKEAKPEVGVSSTEKEKFVFGQNMNARVTSPSKQEGELQHAGQYVFGQNLSDRVKTEEEDKEMAEAAAAESATSLAENAKALETAKERNRVKFDEVEPFTGEEGEQNVIQAQCKLHLFQSDKQTWIERGRGLLRLNDRAPGEYCEQMESRIVMRAQGSLRVLLNAKIWADMTAEKVSTKNIRVSALDSNTGSVKIYLITATPNDAENIYQGIDYRIQALKQSKDTVQLDTGAENGGVPKPETDDSLSNSATTLDSENNEAEYVQKPAHNEEPDKSQTVTSPPEVTSSSKETPE